MSSYLPPLGFSICRTYGTTMDCVMRGLGPRKTRTGNVASTARSAKRARSSCTGGKHEVGFAAIRCRSCFDGRCQRAYFARHEYLQQHWDGQRWHVGASGGAVGGRVCVIARHAVGNPVRGTEAVWESCTVERDIL